MIAVIDVTVVNLGDNQKLIRAEMDGLVIESVVFADEVASVATLATWLLAQRARQEEPDFLLQRRMTIDYHYEPDIGDDGQSIEKTVVDSVAEEPLPEDDGTEGYKALPGWAEWTAGEAKLWVEANVVDLSSAKVALVALAQAVTHLRNITVG